MHVHFEPCQRGVMEKLAVDQQYAAVDRAVFACLRGDFGCSVPHGSVLETSGGRSQSDGGEVGLGLLVSPAQRQVAHFHVDFLCPFLAYLFCAPIFFVALSDGPAASRATTPPGYIQKATMRTTKSGLMR